MEITGMIYREAETRTESLFISKRANLSEPLGEGRSLRASGLAGTRDK